MTIAEKTTLIFGGRDIQAVDAGMLKALKMIDGIPSSWGIFHMLEKKLSMVPSLWKIAQQNLKDR